MSRPSREISDHAGRIRPVPGIDRRVGPGGAIVVGELDIVGRAGRAREGVTQATRRRLIYQGLCRLKSGDRYCYSLL